jgi:hypothetical protein
MNKIIDDENNVKTIYNDPVYIKKKHNEKIILVQQYFIHKNSDRQKEIIDCLKNNVKNKYIDKIYLLNEKIYNKDELYIDSNKIIQINVKNRLTYKMFFDFCNKNFNKSKDYIILSNSDIYFDDSIKNIYTTELDSKKCCYSQLRIEDDTKEIFGPRKDSQDTWIFHSKYIPQNTSNYNFMLGMPGCDNKILHILHMDDYIIYNEPYRIKTYHIHKTNIRNYTNKDVLSKPYVLSIPYLTDNNIITTNYDNKKLYYYLKNKIKNNKEIYIPRVAGIEHELSFYNLVRSNDISYIVNKMKTNAGIKIENNKDYKDYVRLYYKSLYESEIYFNWPDDSDVASKYSVIRLTNKIINRNTISATEISPLKSILNKQLHFSQAFRGKRILIINPFVKSIKKQLEKRKELFDNYELFPECSFIFIKPPQTTSIEYNDSWTKYFKELCDNVKKLENDFDIALCSCGGYGNLITYYIYKELNKSAICMGGILQLYFGVIGNRWINNDLIKLINNKYSTEWIRPLDEEKPINYKNIENGCYW